MGSSETVAGAPSDLRATLADAAQQHYTAYTRARALIALLDKMEFADAMAAAGDDSSYDLVAAVEDLLARLRDDSLSAHDRCDRAATMEAANV